MLKGIIVLGDVADDVFDLVDCWFVHDELVWCGLIVLLVSSIVSCQYTVVSQSRKSERVKE